MFYRGFFQIENDQVKQELQDMSEVSMFELEDIIDYRESKIDRVPQRCTEVVDVRAAQGDCVATQFSAGIKTANITVPKNSLPTGEEATFPVLKEGQAPMLDKNSSFYNNQEFPDSKGSDNCYNDIDLEPVYKVFSDDEIQGTRDAGTNNGLYNFPFTDMYQSNGDINLFGNKHENQECSFLSYDGWPDTSYIEDLDGLFRNQDCSFGKENVSNDDDISWFSRSSHTIDDSSDASEQGLKPFFSDPRAFERSLKDHESDEYHVPCSAIPDSDGKNVSSSYSTMDHSFYGNCLDANSESMSEHVSEKEALKVNAATGDTGFSIIEANSESSENDTLRREKIKKRKQTEPKRNDHNPENSTRSSFIIPSTTSQQLANPTKMSSDSSTNCIALQPEKNVEKVYWKHHMEALTRNQFQHKDLVSHAAFTDQAHIPKQVHQTQDGVEYHCEAENGSIGLPDLNTDLSVLFESSGVGGLGADKISVDETNFLQLQYVMGQLDIRAKLCIRDSLYRLARSAEQRNKMEHSGSSGRDECGQMAYAESNNCTVFMDVETNTNPIDRSVAHLLFHRPAEGISPESHASANFTHLLDQDIVF